MVNELEALIFWGSKRLERGVNFFVVFSGLVSDSGVQLIYKRSEVLPLRFYSFFILIALEKTIEAYVDGINTNNCLYI